MRRVLSIPWLFLLVSAMVIAACSAGDALTSSAAASGSGSGAGGEALGLGGSGGSSTPPECGFIQIGSEMICAGLLADKAFRHAACTCSPGILLVSTDSYDSQSDPATSLSGAPVGINGFGAFGTDPPTDIGGTLITTGDIDVWSMNVHGQMRVGGEVRVFPETPYTLHVFDNAWVAGKITGTVQIDQDLNQPSGVVNGPSLTVSGTTNTLPVTVTEPCPCDSSELIDIPAIVTAGASANDNTSLGLPADALANVVQSREVVMPCGAYYFAGIHASDAATLTLKIDGHVALLVDGPFSADVGAKIVADIAPEGSLDLFVLGQFGTPYGPSATDNIALGAPERAAAVRIYVWDPNGILLLGGSEFVGNLYAPNVQIVAGGLDVYGAILTGSPNLNHVSVHYDRAILDVDEQCPEPPSSCDSCEDCVSSLACIDGTCANCTQDSDCCPPLVCLGNSHLCGPLLR